MDREKSTNSDAQLIQQLDLSPESAMEQLMERYVGLVRSVAERFLQDPEDVKECVNDTFMEFYRSRGRYDAEKSSLGTYLAAIAKKQAISRFRKNTAQPTSELPEDVADERDPIGDAERRMDLDEAVSRLSPEDAELIRMKYFDGMTLQEVADAQGLPHETVKKRHQRSLSKLKALLITGLVLLLAALLAACAYAVLRHFGLLPGYGVSTESDGPVYLLAEESSVECGHWTYTVEDAVLLGGTLDINVIARFPEGGSAWEQWKEMRGQYEAAYFDNISINGTSVSANWVQQSPVSGSNGPYEHRIKIGILPKDVAPLLTGDETTLTMRLFDAEIPFTMQRVELESPENYRYTLADEGGVLAIPKREDSALSVELYPLSTGSYEISSDLIYGAYRQGKNGDITVTDESGRTLVGNMVMVPAISSDRVSTWDFGPAEPGAYVLHIPYVYLLYQIPDTQTITVNLETCQWDDQAMELPFGSIYPVSCEKTELDGYPDVPAWRIVMRLDTEMEFNTPPLSVSIVGTETIAAYTALPDHCYEITVRLLTEEEEAKTEHPEVVPMDLTQAKITLVGTMSLLWDQELTIPFTVE